MKSFKLLSVIAALLVFLTDLFVTYSILAVIHPDRLVWFMFWMSVASTFGYVLFAGFSGYADKAAKKGGTK